MRLIKENMIRDGKVKRGFGKFVYEVNKSEKDKVPEL